MKALLKFLPHTKRKETEFEVSEVKEIKELSKADFALFPELYKNLKNSRGKIQALKNVMIINDILDFSLELYEKGERVQFDSLIFWSNKLLVATRNFEVDEIESMLDELLEILN